MSERAYNAPYAGEHLNRVAFPLGGIGAGMICLEGTGALSHVSVRNHPDIFNEPCAFAAICVKGEEKVARVLEGPVPKWKAFGTGGAGNGGKGRTIGLPRFRKASFTCRFPFGSIMLSDPKVPFEVEITGWSPFIPGDADACSLPVAGIEYCFTNPTSSDVEAVFSFNTVNFMAVRDGNDRVLQGENGFVLWQPGSEGSPHHQGAFCACVDDDSAIVDHAWFRGAPFDALVNAWRIISAGEVCSNPPLDGPSPGASVYVPFTLKAGGEKIIRLMLSWHVPASDICVPKPQPQEEPCACAGCGGTEGSSVPPETYVPWYAAEFEDVREVASYWRENYDVLREKSALFRDCFYDTTLPGEVVEAVAANLTILKSPTVMRQTDGRFWGWEGSSDARGCCPGSCTHVWNYAQALPHLLPDLERSLRRTEFNECQDADGHQTFRAPLPIRRATRRFHAAADGQLGGIMKVYRDWRISGDTGWLKALWPKVKESLDYCIAAWDIHQKGIVEAPHHNTYDIEFWGPNGMCTSFYLGALCAAVEMGRELGEEVSDYEELLAKGTKHLETELFNGEYFFQKVKWEGLKSEFEGLSTRVHSPEAEENLEREGPKYQYGNGCLSDGVLGFWMARVCGLDEIVSREKVVGTLKAIHKYNLKRDLSEHANPARPTYALGDEGGLLLCTWPKGGIPSFPFYFAYEVWTGIEYQAASHMMMEGMVEEGLEIVRLCRDRYDGVVRNPFNEYECGHWYARAMSSYALIQGLTGVRYDAVDKALYIDSGIGDSFRCFLSTATGFGTVGLKQGKPFVEIKMGRLDVEHVFVSGKEMRL